ncbi:MAG: topoisomerase IV [Clostridiales bacterium]|nr:topoisomerase IV [Clostridiales bacterium]
MARKKSNNAKEKLEVKPVEITVQPITETIEKNFMPYAMSVIVARAIPEIDGFKPAHRKLLYTMYKMGLLTGARVKSANVVGQTMRLSPHGDAAIYETLVRLTRGNDTLLHPFIDSKGSFGKHYSSDMAYAAQRYTEVKLDPFCSELFSGINMNSVDFVPNYDNTTEEPLLLPTTFPNILVTPNLGIAVGMASKICSFNLAEVCDAATQMLMSPETTVNQLLDILVAPDFSNGADLIYSRSQLHEIYSAGRGSFRLRSRYVYDKSANCINITQIPYTTTIEAIIKRISDLVKDGKLKEITDFRDEIDLSGFKLTLDLRRGVDPDKLMLKLFKITPLEDSFDCNFNVLIDGIPRQLGVPELLDEWIRFRVGCIRRELTYQLDRQREKLHLLLALGKILLDIDKAIAIIRDTKLEKDVVPNLMDGFGIDQVQAEFIAEIKLRNLNREHILNRLQEIEDLQKEIADLELTVASDKKLKTLIVGQLKNVKKKYGKPRMTQLIYEDELVEYEEEEEIDTSDVRIVFTSEGYFKKVTKASLRGNDEFKLKDGDTIIYNADVPNNAELLFFSDLGQCYKAKVSDFEPQKAAELGEYIPVRLDFDEGERAVTMAVVTNFMHGNMIFIFQNGKGVRIPISAYETKTNRRKLTGAYSVSSPIVGIFQEDAPVDILLTSDGGRALVFSSNLIAVKTTRSSVGNAIFTLKEGQSVISASLCDLKSNPDAKSYRKTKIPSTGAKQILG